MFKKGSIFAVMASAIGLPYLISNGKDLQQKVMASFSSSPAATTEQAATQPAGATSNFWGLSQPQQNPSREAWQPAPMPANSMKAIASRTEIQPLDAVFRWDITTQWVLGSWSRVSTSLAELDLQGYRVALVTGTTDGDLAGSLTYYFNPKQRLQRIIFQGTTGDARPLVHLLATKHNFTRQITPDPSMYLYQVYEKRKIMSELRIKPASIVRQNEHFARFDVTLVMERPASMP
jgi:hypothetical protein